MKLKQSGSVFLNHGLWYYSVRLPGEQKRKQVPLCAPNSDHTLSADRPRKMAEEAAARYWEEHTRSFKRHEPTGLTVSDLCDRWKEHCYEYYRRPDGTPTSMATNAIIAVRMFRDLYGKAALSELQHKDMLIVRDALIRSGVCRGTVNRRLWCIRHMLEWALDEALIPALVKAELTQVKGIKRGRTAARECPPVRPVDDATIYETLKAMVANTADMVRVHRLTGMRPCELCAMRWEDIDTNAEPWIYRVPDSANKNQWRGELGMPRVVCIGPKAREILSRHRGTGRGAPFSPLIAMMEHIEAAHEARVTPFYGKAKAREEARRAECVESAKNGPRSAPHMARVLGDAWNTDAYSRTIRAACERAGIAVWSANRLRHAFGTEVRRKFGLEAARAVLGHTGGGCVTDIYTRDAIEEDMVRRAAPAVEALG